MQTITPDLRNRAWKRHPEEYRQAARDKYAALCSELDPEGDGSQFKRGMAYALELFFGKDNLTSESDPKEILAEGVRDALRELSERFTHNGDDKLPDGVDPIDDDDFFNLY